MIGLVVDLNALCKMSMKMKIERKDKFESVKTFRRALRINVVNKPDSVLGDLMAHFDNKIVIKLIRLYSAKLIKIPDVHEIWRVYRDKIVRNELDKEDTRERRIKLAAFFRISLSLISAILHRERREHPDANDLEIEDVVRHIYDKDLIAGYKEVVEVYPNKGPK